MTRGDRLRVLVAIVAAVVGLVAGAMLAERL